jgi:hypothetical protein
MGSNRALRTASHVSGVFLLHGFSNTRRESEGDEFKDRRESEGDEFKDKERET